ncbi:APC amino acid permease [Lentinus tigrinus ALCF2SS1-6]|uniref:APC amino acid permease n=1 Tax=Lentinus tigrinus ALCF2SS1-6 TaxID=1328759 RepID=A0A5C2SNH2_9APHY|nr:APC amino acid permease [Lentinus tigrinus ALCF2SS1-6]
MEKTSSTEVSVQDALPTTQPSDLEAKQDGGGIVSDAAILASLGYKQEFKRAFSPVEVFGLGFSIIGVFPSIASVLVFAIPYGGPVALVWGWAICCFFLMFIAFAIAELGSAAPTSGGLYYWTWTFATPRWRNVLSWIVGSSSLMSCIFADSNSIGLIAGLAGVDWGCAVQVMAAVSISTDESFVPTTGQIYGLFIALLICHGIVASLATHVIARLQGFYITFNVLLCLAVIISLAVATPSDFRNSASYAFGGFTKLYDWPNGFAFVLSFLAPLWTVGGFDTAVHISEEATNARTAVPWAIISGVGAAGVLGWAINIALAFNMGKDMESIVSNPIGQPMATILFNSLGRNGTLAIWAVVVVAQFLMGSGSLIAASRQVFAFARDGALPFSRIVCRVNPYTQTPVNAVWSSVLIALLFGLLAFAGPAANSAIFSLAIAGQYIAYAIPIMCRFLGGKAWKPGPFSLGRLGLPVAVVAVSWMIFSIVIVAFPAAPAPDTEGMNYMSVVMGGWVDGSSSASRKHWFNGPQTTLDGGRRSGPITVSNEDSVSSQSDGEKRRDV